MGIFDELKQTAETALKQEVQQLEQQGIAAAEAKIGGGAGGMNLGGLNIASLLGGAHPTEAAAQPKPEAVSTDDAPTGDSTGS